jgi:hypothetical protein
MRAILGSGPLPGKIVSDGEVVQVKEQVFSWWEILDPQNRRVGEYPKDGTPGRNRTMMVSKSYLNVCSAIIT